MKRFFAWCKSEIVLCIAFVLALVSSCFVLPDKAYVTYIDFRTLAILFCLMVVMAGFQKVGLFQWIAEKLLQKIKNIRGIVFLLIALYFFSSMLITNDVALITFIPFAFIVLRMVLKENAEKMIVPVVVMQTIAANLGSMLTPIGNPQNLYLYGKSGVNFLEFLWLMFPYTIVSLVLLSVWCLMFPYKGEKKIRIELEQKTNVSNVKKELIVYTGLFVICVLTVAHVIPYMITLAIVILAILFLDRKVFADVDYALLFTFVGFFVFIGNIGRIPAFNSLLQSVIKGNEILTSIVSSQFMSNVPTALLLSGFTKEYELLIIGTNLGGLGTLIASMASLISFKYIGKEYRQLKGKYLIYFTVANLMFLLILFGMVLVL